MDSELAIGCGRREKKRKTETLERLGSRDVNAQEFAPSVLIDFPEIVKYFLRPFFGRCQNTYPSIA